MTKIEVTKRTARTTRVVIGGKAAVLRGNTHDGFWRICELRGWTPQETFDHVMATSARRPWIDLVARLGMMRLCKDMRTNERLGEMRVIRMEGQLRFYRQTARFVTPIVRLPADLICKYAHICEGDTCNEGGAVLFSRV